MKIKDRNLSTFFKNCNVGKDVIYILKLDGTINKRIVSTICVGCITIIYYADIESKNIICFDDDIDTGRLYKGCYYFSNLELLKEFSLQHNINIVTSNNI